MSECLLLEEETFFYTEEHMGNFKLHDKWEKNFKSKEELNGSCCSLLNSPAKLCSNSMKGRGGEADK